MDTVDAVVIGAGVIGLAVARALALSGRQVVIVEAERRFGSITSSRNSEVIHAGIYYPRGSLKAQSCIAGQRRLYEYCASHNVAHRRCGKLIVATSDAEITSLAQLRASAHANGTQDVEWADAASVEPELRCTAALLSPSTGIIDAHGYMLALLGDAEDAGAMVAYDTVATAARRDRDGLRLTTSQGDIATGLVVNAAGHGAIPFARAVADIAGVAAAAALPQAHFAKGNYFTLAGRSPFSRLIYPAPVDGGLGVHLTIDLAGQARFGPDVEWIDSADYHLDAARAERFYTAIRRYWPALGDGALQPGYAGVRPKLSGPGEAAADFRIDGPQVHGVPGLISLFGIESPGLTASLSLADHVLAMAEAT